MNLSEGQVKALEQLDRIAEIPESALRIDYIDFPKVEGSNMLVDISIDCRLCESVEGGLKLNAREAIQVLIPENFPYSYPTVWVAHRRFKGHPHVQWIRYICLYQAPDTEWRPQGGMFDFMRRVYAWFKSAALNQLDVDGEPLHPPAVYPTASTTIITNADTPSFKEDNWIGGAVLNQTGKNRFELNEWLPFREIVNNPEAVPAILLSTPFSFEYPKFVSSLVNQLEIGGVSLTSLITLLSLAAKTKDEEKPMHVIVGTPMRGIAGINGERSQHLAVWEIEPIAVKQLALVTKAIDLCIKWGDNKGKAEIFKLTDDIIKSFKKWMNEARIGWCYIMENRPEVTQRRDELSPMNAFNGKKIGLLGCGAIGGCVAEHLARANAKHITLIDNSKVHPGILVRQNFKRDDIGAWKSDALQGRLIAINPSLNCKSSPVNIYNTLLTNSDWFEQFDIVIDATASLRVRTKLEELWQKYELNSVLATLMVSSGSDHAVMAIVTPGYTGATLDVLRKLGLSVMNREHLSIYKKAFWDKESDNKMFQPEPGCSDPTFSGSNADIGGLSGKMLNKLAEVLSSGNKLGYGSVFSRESTEQLDQQFTYQPDILVKTDRGIDVRVSQHVWRDIIGWLNSGARERGTLVETGGLLFGEFNDVVNVLWINEVIGPPSDSEFSEEDFICGTNGSQEINQEKKKRTENSVKFIGTWHSHPISPAQPSQKDWHGISNLFTTDLNQSPQQLMMIVGHASKNPEIGAHIFNRKALLTVDDSIHVAVECDGGVKQNITPTLYGKKIGLALSGGGTRAIAYHLGCLRALNDLGLMDEVDVLSGVSGGAVMAALLGYTNDDFEEVDKKTVRFLNKGLLWPTLIRLIFKFRFIPSLLTFVISVVPGFLIDILKKIIQFLLSLIGIHGKSISWIKSIRWPLRRWYSRTNVMAEEIQKLLGKESMNSPTRNNKDVVFNACELATGTAFRMSNRGYGSWRFGKGKAEDILVANAVAASAAFPPGLPAFDWVKSFEDKKSKERINKRVVITDGGVYENLGVSCMEPGKSSDYSVLSYNPEIIISCDAGAGQFSGDAATEFWPLRMSQAFEAVYRKVQDATKARLHNYVKNGELEAFVYSNLGQIDSKIPVRPSVWITRKEVMDYPTNFSAMNELDVIKITARGEAVTRTLVSKYLLSE